MFVIEVAPLPLPTSQPLPMKRSPTFLFATPQPGTVYPYGSPVPAVAFTWDMLVSFGRPWVPAEVIVESRDVPPVITRRIYWPEAYNDLRIIGRDLHIFAYEAVEPRYGDRSGTTGIRRVTVRIPDGFLGSLEGGLANGGETTFSFGDMVSRMWSRVEVDKITLSSVRVLARFDTRQNVTCSAIPIADVVVARLPALR
jgi:hypothetical protein